MKILLNSPDTITHPGFARTPSPLTSRVIHSGNSGTDPIFTGNVPGAINSLIAAYSSGTIAAHAKSTTPGSPMRYRWDNPTSAPDARLNIGDFDVLVITSVSGDMNTNTYQPTIDGLPAEAFQWVQNTWTSANSGAGGETLFWTTWARTDIPDIAAQYALRKTLWAQMQDYANARRPTGQKPVRIIPGAWLWHKFWLDEQAGTGPTPTFYSDRFTDEFHQDQKSAYIQTILHVACIHGIDPRALPTSISGLTPLTTPEYEYVMTAIKQVVSSVKRSGVDTSSWS